MSNRAEPDPIWTLVRAESVPLGTATLLVSLASLLELAPYLLVYAAAIEVFAAAPRHDSLVVLSATLFGVVALRFVLLGCGYIISHRVAFRLVRKVREALADKLTRVPSGFFHARSSGDLKKILVEDAGSLEGALAHNLPELTSGLFVPLTAALVLAFVDWRMALAAIALLPVAFAVQAVLMRDVQEAWASWHAAEARANAGILEFIRGIAVLKAFDRGATSMAAVREGIYGIRDLAVAMTRRSMTGYAVFMSLLANNLLIVLPVGLALYLSGSITREELVLFVALGAGMLLPLLKLLFLFGNAQKLSVTLNRIRLVLAAPELHEPTPEARLGNRLGVRFEAVSHTYADREGAALKDVSVELKPGTVTALVGESGAGKTTLVKLLVREFDPTGGAITIGDCALNTLTSSQRAKTIAHVAQDTTLFDGTVGYNLRLAKPEASHDDLVAAARAARAHDFIEALPDGYDTNLGDRGAQLSGGERQRIAIARALLKDAPVVVLDEVTANVDPESEVGIQDGLSALARGRTVLVVAHRLRTVAEVDQIVVLDRGEVVDIGQHESLLARSEGYARLWHAQATAHQWTLPGGGA